MNYKLQAIVECDQCEEEFRVDLDMDTPLDGQVAYRLQQRDWELSSDRKRCSLCVDNDDDESDREDDDEESYDAPAFNNHNTGSHRNSEANWTSDLCSCCGHELDSEERCPNREECEDCD